MASTLTMTLAETVNSGGANQNPMALAIIRETIYLETFLWASMLPSKAVNGISNTYRREVTRPLVKTHNVGGAISEGYATYNVITDTAGRAIAQIPMDMKVQTAYNLTNVWSDQLQSARYEFGDKLSNDIINGAGATDGAIHGLKTLCDDFGAGQKFVASTTCSGGAIELLDLDKIANKVRYPNKFFLTHPNLYLDIKALGMAMGGNSWREVMVPYAVATGNGYVTINERPVMSYNGIPIFESEWMTSESTYGKTGKYRIICASLAPGRGLEFFYPGSIGGRPSTLGFQMEEKKMKEDYDEEFVRMRWMYGLSCYSSKSIAQGVNYKFVNA